MRKIERKIPQSIDKSKYNVTLNQAYSIKELLARHQAGLPLPSLSVRYSQFIDESDPNPDPLSEDPDLSDYTKELKRMHNEKIRRLRDQRKKALEVRNQPPIPPSGQQEVPVGDNKTPDK